MKDLAPVVLFVYNRPEHTKKTLYTLQKNQLASKSELFIYSDEAKSDVDRKCVDEVRDLISDISGFKKVMIIKQEKNIGLADSIISGVTDVVNKYGKVIVLEDDLITSPFFLNFMNNALDFYENKNKVWHISGWNYPIEFEGLPDAFLWRTMSCWGWATWADRWSYFEKDTDNLVKNFTSKKIKSFNLDSHENFWGQVLDNKKGKINTWAIYWYASIFINDGLCLNPTQTYIENIGLDGTGIHCAPNDSYKSKLNKSSVSNFQTEIKENSLAINRIKFFFKSQKKTLIIRLINKILKFSRGFNGFK